MRSEPPKQLLLIVALIALFVSIDQAATLTHRYSFDTNANDSIGGANGTLLGIAVLTNGAVLIGRGGGVLLPANLFTNYDSISFEAWFVDQNVTNINTSLSEYVYNFSGAGGAMSYSIFKGGSWSQSGVSQTIGIPSPIPGRTNHLVWTQDTNLQTACLYMNGVLAGQITNFTFTPTLIGPTSINEIGNNSAGDTSRYFNGSILEFRAYQGALSSLEVAQSDAAGPDQSQVNPGLLQDLQVVVPSPFGPGAFLQPVVYADFANLTNVNVIGQPALTLLSDNTNVIVVTTNQKLMTVGLGTANVTAVYQGFTNTFAATVSVPQDIALIHRYGFNEQTNNWIAHDSVSGANGRVFGASASFVSFTGQGELKMRGYPFTGAYVGLPGGIISCLSEVSIEAWVTWTPGNSSLKYSGGAAWQRIFDFGSLVNGRGFSYLFLTPATDSVSFTTNSLLHTAITTNYNIAETPRLNWTNIFPTNVLSHVAVTYSPVRGVMKLYLNGVPVASDIASIPLSGIADINNWLGSSQFSGDPYFYGSYNEFRIYSGLLSDSDVAADYAAGPDVVGVDYVLHSYMATNSLTITWGLSATNWYLESSPSLGPGAVWNPVPITPLQNGRNNVTVPVSADAAFFRLHAP